jgi:hypothetical protein
VLVVAVKHFKYRILEDCVWEMNHSRTTLAFASIMVAGTVTGVALAILLQQALATGRQHGYALGTPGTSVDAANGGNGASGVNGNNANGADGISARGPNGINGDTVASSWVFLS